MFFLITYWKCTRFWRTELWFEVVSSEKKIEGIWRRNMKMVPSFRRWLTRTRRRQAGAHWRWEGRMASHARVHRQPHSYGFMFSVTDEENDGGGKTAALHHLCQIFVDAEINLASRWVCTTLRTASVSIASALIKRTDRWVEWVTGVEIWESFQTPTQILKGRKDYWCRWTMLTIRLQPTWFKRITMEFDLIMVPSGRPRAGQEFRDPSKINNRMTPWKERNLGNSTFLENSCIIGKISREKIPFIYNFLPEQFNMTINYDYLYYVHHFNAWQWY